LMVHEYNGSLRHTTTSPLKSLETLITQDVDAAGCTSSGDWPLPWRLRSSICTEKTGFVVSFYIPVKMRSCTKPHASIPPLCHPKLHGTRDGHTSSSNVELSLSALRGDCMFANKHASQQMFLNDRSHGGWRVLPSVHTHTVSVIGKRMLE
jgi:hypothetical protein